jgi:hypothetical protein
MSEKRGIRELSFLEKLELAKQRLPKSYDSKGKAYYLGPTAGQFISWWWGDNDWLGNKIGEEIRKGTSTKDILATYRSANKELCEDAIEWLRACLQRDDERRSKFVTGVAKQKIV